ncbi:MAG: hypothetical protein HYZ25_05810 [Chloroflexi bacterium]|nr:hypothetical protein [Chloroflexota bacterium]
MSAMQAFYEQISASDSANLLTALSRASRTQIMDATRDSTWMLWDMSQD